MTEQDRHLNSPPDETKGAGEEHSENSCHAGNPFSSEEGAVAGEEGPVSDDRDAGAIWLQEKKDLVEQLQRERANFDNFRRISRQQQDHVREYALCEFFKKLLPVLDDLERAIISARNDASLSSHVMGLEMIYNQLFKLLSREGVCRIEAEGQAFDPNIHHAVAQIEGGAEPGMPGAGEPAEEISGTVAEELTRGYTYKDRILRPSMVKVYK